MRFFMECLVCNKNSCDQDCPFYDEVDDYRLVSSLHGEFQDGTCGDITFDDVDGDIEL